MCDDCLDVSDRIAHGWQDKYERLVQRITDLAEKLDRAHAAPGSPWPLAVNADMLRALIADQEGK